MSSRYEPPDVSLGLGEFALETQGPPWILGARGCPLDAPENTLSSLRLALAAGLDGLAYDARACATGEFVLMADARVDRTTDGNGELRELTLPQLFPLDAGAWFSKRHAGETVPLLDEVLEIFGAETPGALHFIELHGIEQATELLERLSELGMSKTHRLASRSRSVCLEVRDAGHPAVLIGEDADRSARQFVRDERLAGFASTMEGWWRGEWEETWSCERWGIGVDSPEALVRACTLPLFGFTTREAARALAFRALAAMAPGIEEPPLRVPPLPIEPGGIEGVRGEGTGEWAGTWQPTLEFENPFHFPVHVQLGLRVRRGAFEVEGLPVEFDLGGRQIMQVPTRIVGGSWSPGGDPVALAIVRWESGAGRRAGQLLIEAPLVRLRTVALDEVSRRLILLKENPQESEASLILRRTGSDLLISIENPGEIEEAHIIVRVGDRVVRGGMGLRVRMPAQLGAEGLPFSCGIEGLIRRPGRTYRVLRRWAGGLPEHADSGEPGRILESA